jgi:hypothetical protein
MQYPCRGANHAESLRQDDVVASGDIEDPVLVRVGESRELSGQVVHDRRGTHERWFPDVLVHGLIGEEWPKRLGVAVDRQFAEIQNQLDCVSDNVPFLLPHHIPQRSKPFHRRFNDLTLLQVAAVLVGDPGGGTGEQHIAWGEPAPRRDILD